MGKQVAVVVDESNRKNPNAKVSVIEKDIPTPGPGEVLIRIDLTMSSMRNTKPVKCFR